MTRKQLRDGYVYLATMFAIATLVAVMCEGDSFGLFVQMWLVFYVGAGAYVFNQWLWDNCRDGVIDNIIERWTHRK